MTHVKDKVWKVYFSHKEIRSKRSSIRFGLGPLHYLSSRSDFGFKFSEIFIFKNQLPASVSQGVDKIAWSNHFFQTFK
jgi:hypothetical protein